MHKNFSIRSMLVGAIAIIFGGALVVPARAEDPIVKLVNGASSECLQPVNSSSAAGVAIVQQPCNGSTLQQWKVTSVNSTRVHLVNMATKLCMDARGGATNGTPIQQWPCNKITNENWSFGITNNILSSAVSNTFSHCIFSPGTQNGLQMSLRACSIMPAQIWNRPAG